MQTIARVKVVLVSEMGPSRGRVKSTPVIGSGITSKIGRAGGNTNEKMIPAMMRASTIQRFFPSRQRDFGLSIVL